MTVQLVSGVVSVRSARLFCDSGRQPSVSTWTVVIDAMPVTCGCHRQSVALSVFTYKKHW